MRLAAIYIHKHDFLFDKPQTINLGGKYIYSFNYLEPNSINISKVINKQYIDNFFGENISLVTAIVGANGSGKTNVCLDIINQLGFLSNNSNSLDKFYQLFLFEDGDKTVLNYLYTFEGHFSDDYNMKMKYQDYGISERLANMRTEVLQNEFNFTNNQYEINLNHFKRTFDYINPVYFNFNQFFYDKIKYSFLFETLNNLEFLSDEILISKLESVLGEINFIKAFDIEPNELSFNFKSIELNIHNGISPKINITEYDLDEKLKDGYFVDNKYYFFKYLNDLYLHENRESGVFNFKGQIFYNTKKVNDKFFEFNCQIIARVFYKIISHDYFLYQIVCKKFIKLITYDNLKKKGNFLKVLSSIKSVIKENKVIEFIENVTILVKVTPENFKLEMKNDNLSLNREFILTYNKISEDIILPTIITQYYEDAELVNRNFIKISPSNPISDGERNLIKLFSTLYKNKKHIRDLLILDEAEIGFHPFWKKKIIKSILLLIPTILDSKEVNKIQIIFTSHDPLTLSDIPNNNIVYMERRNGKSKILNTDEKPQKSFGANITDLLADSFFFGNDDKSLIGDFAKGKINDVIKWLNDEKRDHDKKDDYKKIIEMIDEPLISNKLLDMYYEIFPLEYDLEQEKEQVRKKAIEFGLIKE